MVGSCPSILVCVYIEMLRNVLWPHVKEIKNENYVLKIVLIIFFFKVKKLYLTCILGAHVSIQKRLDEMTQVSEQLFICYHTLMSYSLQIKHINKAINQHRHYIITHKKRGCLNKYQYITYYAFPITVNPYLYLRNDICTTIL